eukprot:NODE_2970_length_837_cov_50.015228_g2465_i0.p1 GENE.NODE_2970_length_837_cov_50.015228_g2465_i0~~NODE_2970_length_837_cov_50.015228_g2465_i0.p1  ORF type:complete len:202 (-),score=50.97 NODE_2970_length_837_cov_50.015228_g2465_i0:69-674(-)
MSAGVKKVTPDVLIPRPETEVMLSEALSVFPAEAAEVWDVCCGSGALGVAWKRHRPRSRVVLADVSPAALEVAARNAERNDAEVELRMGDLMEPFEGEQADLILCNPPYISEEEYVQLDNSVRDYEPRMALVAGPTGLEFYDRLSRELPLRLKRGGLALLEVGHTQSADVVELMKGGGGWGRCEVRLDWWGKHRYVLLSLD